MLDPFIRDDPAPWNANRESTEGVELMAWRAALHLGNASQIIAMAYRFGDEPYEQRGLCARIYEYHNTPEWRPVVEECLGPLKYNPNIVRGQPTAPPIEVFVRRPNP